MVGSLARHGCTCAVSRSPSTLSTSTSAHVLAAVVVQPSGSVEPLARVCSCASSAAAYHLASGGSAVFAACCDPVAGSMPPTPPQWSKEAIHAAPANVRPKPLNDGVIGSSPYACG